MKAPKINATINWSATFLLASGLFFCQRAFPHNGDPVEDAKKELRTLIASLQTATVSLGVEMARKEQIANEMQQNENKGLTIYNWQKKHDANPIIYDHDKPKPPEAVSYDNEALQIEAAKSEWRILGAELQTASEQTNSLAENLKDSIRIFKNRIHLKTFDLSKYIPATCGPMPPEDADIYVWKSFLDCLFDNNTRNFTTDPPIGPNTPFFDDDPVSRARKLEVIKKLIKENPPQKKEPVFVPSPVNKDEVKPATMTPTLIDNIKNFLSPPPPKKTSTAATVRG